MFRILYRFLGALAGLAARSGRSKDLEIIVLRRQSNRPTVDDDDRTLLGAIAAALPRRLRQGWIMTPEILLRWHRRRIARHWGQPSHRPGRPSTSAKVASLAVKMSTDNPTWGDRRITGELNRLGHHVGASTVWRILKQNGIDPSPTRSEVTWTQFLRSQTAVACDFATIDTALLRRSYLLFYINVNTREVLYAGITPNPTGTWTTQAARNLFLRHRDRLHEKALTSTDACPAPTGPNGVASSGHAA